MSPRPPEPQVDDPSPPEPPEPSAPTEPATGDGAPAGRSRRVVIAVLVLALLVASGLAVWQTVRLGDAEEETDRRTAAARTAGDFTVALLSYDFEALDEQTRSIQELATEDFVDEFAEAMDGGLGASIEELRARSTATVSEVMVSEAVGDRARAIVVADSEITSEAGTRASTDTYLDVSLVHLDGRWQVDDVRTIAADSPQADTEPDTGTPDVDAPDAVPDPGSGDGDVGTDDTAG